MRHIHRDATQIVRALERTRGNIRRAAEILDMSRPTVLNRIHELGLEARVEALRHGPVPDDILDPDDDEPIGLTTTDVEPGPHPGATVTISIGSYALLQDRAAGPSERATVVALGAQLAEQERIIATLTARCEDLAAQLAQRDGTAP